MNQFKHLDEHFPVLPNRHSGEVVSLSVIIEIQNSDRFASPIVGTISWKRKAWYVNASTNAFILHRKLCGELTEYLDHMFGPGVHARVSKQQVKAAKKLLAEAVWNSYVLNCASDLQYHTWSVVFPPLTSGLSRLPSLWWDADGENTYESTGNSLWRESVRKWVFPGNGNASLPQVALLQERVHEVNK